MSSSEGLPSVPPGSEASYTQSDTRNLSITDLSFRLGSLTTEISNLRDANKSNVEKIEKLEKAHAEKIEQLTLSVFGIPYLETAVAKNEQEVNGVGKRHDQDIKKLQTHASIVKTLGLIALTVLAPILIYIFHLLKHVTP
jgi:hypothetical protein